MPTETKTRIGNRIMLYGGISGALMAIIGLVSFIAGSEYRPVMSIELKEVAIELAASVEDVNQLATEQAINNNQLRTYQNQREQSQLQQQGLPIPNWMIQEQVDLQAEKRRLEKRLKKGE